MRVALRLDNRHRLRNVIYILILFARVIFFNTDLVVGTQELSDTES